MSVFLSDALVLSSSTAVPLTHARIGYRSIIRPGRITASSEQTDYPAINVASVNTYQSWQPVSMPAALTIQSTGETVDYLGMVADSFAGLAVTLESSDDGMSWNIEAIVAPAGRVLMMLLEPTVAQFWRLRLEGVRAPHINVVFLGEALAMQRPIYGGHSPVTLSRQTTIRPQASDTGQFLGRTVIRRGAQTSASWRHLTADWYRQHFDPFVEYATQGQGPFFFAWRPESFPQEVAYVWTSEDIAPSNMGMRDFMEVSLNMTGLA